MKMTIKVNDFRVQANEKVNLEKWPTLVEPVYKSKEMHHKLLEAQVEVLSSRHNISKPRKHRQELLSIRQQLMKEE